jgi:hypothetical protein
MSVRAAAEAVAWVCGAGLCFAAAWATWHGQAPLTDAPAAPPALPRPPTADEEADVQELAAGVLAELRATVARTGGSPEFGELEGRGPDGVPYLPSGLPDNPLAPGVAGVIDGCAGSPPPPGGVDWRYCAIPLMFAPAHAGSGRQSGNP